MSSKRTHWKWIGSNIEDFRTEEQKKKDRRKAFKSEMVVQRMKTNKPKFKRTPKRVDPVDEKA